MATSDAMRRDFPRPSSAAETDREQLPDDSGQHLAALYRLTDRLYRAGDPSETYEAALDTITHALGCRRASILLFDAKGVMRFAAWRGLSDEYRHALEGHSPWKQGDSDPEPIFVQDIEATNEPAPVKARILQEGIRSLGFVPLAMHGRVIGKFMIYFAAPREFSKGEINLSVAIARQLGFAVERSRTEEELRASEAKLREKLENAPVMIWTSFPDGHCEHLNRMLRDFWGLDESDIAGFDFTATVHPDDASDVARLMSQAMRERQPVQLTARYRNAQGLYRLLETDARPRLTVHGEFQGMIGVNVDITERREAQERERLLAREVDHRSKNLLAVVQSVVQLTRGEDIDDFKRAVTGRIQALARAHSLLAAGRWEGVELGQLIREELAPYMRDGLNRVDVVGTQLRLRPSAAQALALVIHELATNAVKYGALSKPTGRIEIRWDVPVPHDRPTLDLTWTEHGGPQAGAPTRQGFGSTVMQSSVERQLGGSIEFVWSPDGLGCHICLPAEQLADGGPSAPMERPGAAPGGSTPAPVAGRRVLVVEDEALVALQIEEALEELGCQIIGTASTVTGAIDLLRTRAPDAAVLDINLGGERSDRVAEALSALGIPFLYCTGYADVGEAVNETNGVARLSKPLDPGLLAKALQQLV